MHKTLFRHDRTKFMYFEKPEGSGRNLLVVKNARLYSHDFGGIRSVFHTRSICIDIPEEIKDLLIEDGWEVKARISEDEKYDTRYYLPVKIQFNEYGPEIVKTGPNTPITYTEDNVDTLDDIDMTDIDIVVSPYRSDRKPTISAFLRELRFKLSMSPLDYEEDDEDNNLPFE